jgi:hypothetical protein
MTKKKKTVKQALKDLKKSNKKYTKKHGIDCPICKGKGCKACDNTGKVIIGDV